jgi:hypothetical protein
MPIPPFDKQGNLQVGSVVNPSGAHNTAVVASMAEIHARFVDGKPEVGNPTRKQIWDGWQRHRQDVRALGLPFVTLVNGSFLTTKPDPGDVDIVLLFDGPASDRLSPKQRALFKALIEGKAVKKTHHCDAYGVPIYPFGVLGCIPFMRLLAYWTRCFGHDKSTKAEKAFLLVTEAVK